MFLNCLSIELCGVFKNCGLHQNDLWMDQSWKTTAKLVTDFLTSWPLQVIFNKDCLNRSGITALLFQQINIRITRRRTMMLINSGGTCLLVSEEPFILQSVWMACLKLGEPVAGKQQCAHKCLTMNSGIEGALTWGTCQFFYDANTPTMTNFKLPM